MIGLICGLERFTLAWGHNIICISMSWYVLKTKPRQEVKAQKFFENIDIETYIPMKKIYLSKKDQRKYKLVPIISTFVFFRLDKLDYNIVNQ
ncbi:hypothetical protein OA501_02735, partial [Flavobacteriaceae bacterium]|nr:hypothetical protein [Flavobacteriaceae bacterium]